MSDSLASQSDAELLKRFSKTRCERVFEELVSRYGRLVMAICLRTLRNQHDAEDVFQATFLVLAEKAGSIRKRNSLSSWLTGTAHRLSIKLAQKRHRKDLALAAEPIAAREQFSDLEKRFDEQAMDEELHALPSKYRDVLVRFYFLGETSRQIAESLGITQGAADGRIKRGRQELRVRLAKRGVALGAFTVMAISAQTTSAAVAPTLVQSTVAAAAAKGSVGLVSSSVVKLAGTELMKTSPLASSVAIACSGIVLLGATALGLNTALAPSMASDGRLKTEISEPSSGTGATIGLLQQEGDIATAPNPDLPQPRVVDPNWDQGFKADEEQVNQPPDLVLDLVEGDPPPMETIKDTATFVFGLDEGALGGDQLFGTMDKVGVHTNVDTAYPDIAEELAHMGAARASREKFLAAEGVDLSNPARRWTVRIWEVAAVGEELRYVVAAAVGRDPKTSRQSGIMNMDENTIIHELWRKHADGSNPTLLRRSLHWDRPDAN